MRYSAFHFSYCNYALFNIAAVLIIVVESVTYVQGLAGDRSGNTFPCLVQTIPSGLHIVGCVSFLSCLIKAANCLVVF
jgi:hypothetical protein